MRKYSLLLVLTCSMHFVQADWISLIRADQCETIIEMYVYQDYIKVTLEIGEKDYQHFQYIIPEEYLEEGMNEKNQEEYLVKFYRDILQVRADGKLLTGELKELRRDPRNYRASLYTGQVDTMNLTISSRVVFAEFHYPLRKVPSAVSITPPLLKGYNSTLANIGFVGYHKQIPVNDLRYLGATETMRLDWEDPWYSKFDNRNLTRHHKYSLMSYLYVDPYEIRHEVLVRLKDLESWIEFNYGPDDKIAAKDLDSIKVLVADFLIERNLVSIDGEQVEPTLDKVHFVKVALWGIQILEIPEDMDYSSSIVGVIFVYPHDSIPQNVVVNWDMWNDRMDKVPCIMSDPAGPLPYDLTPDDTFLVWNNYLKNYKIPTVVEVKVTNASFSYPVISILIMIGLFIFVWRNGVSIGQWEKSKKVQFFIGLLIAVLGLLYRPSIEIPFIQKQSFSKPEAEILVSELLKNTYRAFDFREEGAVYDKLAISNDGNLLSEIYIQTKQSMVLENQGGIQVRLKSVDILDVQEIESDDQGLAYQCQWIVEGNVGHWGHIHKRINKYIAEIKVKSVDGVWKMYELDIIEESRQL